MLPVELWQVIVRNATLVQAAFDFNHFAPMDAGLGNIDWSPSAHQRNLKTKRAVITVSRTWWQIGLPYLYETLIVASSSFPGVIALENLPAILARGYGKHVRRFEIHTFEVARDQIPALHVRLAEAYSLCPNIEVCIMDHRDLPPSGKDWLQPLFALPRHQLRALSYSVPTHIGSPLQDHFDQLTQLEFLHLGMIEERPRTTRDLLLPSLQTLSIRSQFATLDGILPIIAHWELPSLNYASVKLNANSHPFLGARASQLRCLELATSSPFNDLSDLSEFLSRFSQLEDIIYESPKPTVPLIPLPSVQRIGLSCEPSIDPLDNHFETIFGAENIYPQLKIIRLLKLYLVQPPARTLDPETFDFWQRWLSKWHARGIRLENSRGELLRLPLATTTRSRRR